ncbi:TPA: hypothetical protein SMQ11_003821 [Proteus mirabilis]|nr:hypothetical protein [Proteus mirabilis]HEK1946725.1 hypothetical protein [Proteus mirabilis]
MKINLFTAVAILAYSSLSFSSGIPMAGMAAANSGYVDVDEKKVSEKREVLKTKLFKECQSKKIIANGNKNACRQYADEQSLQQIPLVRGSNDYMQAKYNNLSKDQALDELAKLVKLGVQVKKDQSNMAKWDGKIYLVQLDTESNFILSKYFSGQTANQGLVSAEQLLARKGKNI